MQSLNLAFAHHLRMRRKELGYTQKTLGEKIGYTEKAVSKWESGVALPPTETLLHLAQVLQTGIDALLYYEEEPEYFLGIDGGATKTDFALADRDGKILRCEKLGPCNPVDLGMKQVKETLQAGIRLVCAEIPYEKISVYAGISGGMTGDYRTQISRFLQSYRFAKCQNGSNAENILAGGLGKEDGIAVILGTGSIAVAQKGTERHRIGGFGYLFDLGGSGYDLGRDAIRAALCDWDSSGPSTILRQMIESTLGKPIIDALAEFYEKGKHYIASFAPFVWKAVAQHDIVAEQILRRNMEYAANLIRTGGAYFPKNTQIPVVLVGGLTNQAEILLPALSACLSPKRFLLRVYNKPPVYGALKLAGASGMEDAEISKMESVFQPSAQTT